MPIGKEKVAALGVLAGKAVDLGAGRSRPTASLEGVSQNEASAVPNTRLAWRAGRWDHRRIGYGSGPRCLTPAKGPLSHHERLAGSVRDIGNPDLAVAKEDTLAVHPWLADAEDTHVAC